MKTLRSFTQQKAGNTSKRRSQPVRMQSVTGQSSMDSFIRHGADYHERGFYVQKRRRQAF